MTKAFYDDLVFEVPTGVYEPREDSHLAADVLEEMDLEGKTVLDIGTGCGFLAVVAAAGGADVTATDINQRALDAAGENASTNGYSIETLNTDMFEGIESKFDVIVFNAPYIPGSRDGRSTEELAWYGGDDGRELVDRFIAEADTYLADDGDVLLVQSSMTGETETLERFEEHGFDAEVAANEKVAWERLIVVRAWKI
jgi:release factor glutamine methyltransferase